MYHLNLTLDPAGKKPMYEQLYRFLADEIRSGVIGSGERLPSKRALCAQLGVSRSTVEAACDLLLAEGYAVSRPRSGFFAADVLTQTAPTEQPARKPAPPEPVSREEDLFSTSAVDVSQFPYASWAKLYREVIYHSPALLQRGEAQGEPELQQALARLLSEYRSVRCDPEQIVVGSGLETLLSQLITLFGPKTVYALEDPGYPFLERTLRARERAIRYIPLDGDGMDAAALEASHADVAYLTPSHQFPMGVTMPASRRSRLLRWAEAGDRWIIEDDYDSEFRYGGRPLSSMQGMDRAERVIYTGTFSRSLAPSIRLAFMVLPHALLERFRAVFGREQTTVSRYEQTVMARFLDEGFYSRYLRRVGLLYARRREALLEALRGIDGVTVSGAGGGIHFLLTNPRWTEAELIEKAAAIGLRLAGLSSLCRTVPALASTLIVGYGGLPTARIPEIAQKLREAWAENGQGRP